MKAQISLEYLLVFSISISVLLIVLPVVSEIEDTSRKVVLKSRLDSLARKTSNGCEELLFLGKDNVFVTEVSFSVEVESQENDLVISSGGLTSKARWRDSCRLNSNKFSAGDKIRVLKDLT